MRHYGPSILFAATPGLPARLGYRRSYDPAALALFAAFSVQPNEWRKASYNRYILALKTAGLWTKLDVILVLAAHTSQAALINVKSPGTFNATLVEPTTAVTFTADRGFTFNGTDNYLDTNFNPSTAGGFYTQNSAMFGCRSRTSAQISASRAGWFDGTDGTTLNHRSVTDTVSFRLNQAVTSSVASITDGVSLVTVNRNGASTTQCYRSGAAQTVSNPNVTSTALNNNDLYVGRSTATAWSPFEAASAYIGGSLTSGEHSALRLADLAYMQAVGAV